MHPVFQSRINYSTTLFVLFCFLFIYLLLLLLFFFYFYEKTNTRVAIIMHYNNDSKASNSPLITYSLLPKFTTSLIILLTKQFLFVYRAHSIVQPYFSRAYVTRCDLVVDNFFQGCLMTECLNGGYCSFDKEKASFACSCKQPWTGEKCEQGKPE